MLFIFWDIYSLLQFVIYLFIILQKKSANKHLAIMDNFSCELGRSDLHENFSFHERMPTGQSILIL